MKCFIKNYLKQFKNFIKSILGRSLFYSVNKNIDRETLGSGYGQWTVCPKYFTNNSIIYSFGIGEELTFELTLIKKYGVNVYAFDPTPRSITWINSQVFPKEFKFFNYGIFNKDGIFKFNPPANPNHVSFSLINKPSKQFNSINVQFYRLDTIFKKLNHTYIDLLKLDIEGAEYAVIKDIIKSNIEIKQILVEFHHHFDTIEISESKKIIKLLKTKGYSIFNISPSNREFSFIKV